MKVRDSGHRSGGFTVTELLITITIASILAAIGIPSYRSITNSARISAEVNGLLGDMLLARSEALKRGLRVSVCISSSGTDCDTSGLNWHNGWIVFLDNDGDQAVDAGPPADTIMKVQARFNGGDTFVSNNTRAVTFNREGFATASTLVTLHAAAANDASTRCLSLNQLGRAKVVKVGKESCT